MSCIAYPSKTWRKDADMHRLIGSGDQALPAVIACCGPSEQADHQGEFWWGCGDLRGYEPTLDQAKAKAEEAAIAREKE